MERLLKLPEEFGIKDHCSSRPPAIRLNPNYADAYEKRGEIYLHAGDRAKATDDFATARRLKAAQ